MGLVYFHYGNAIVVPCAEYIMAGIAEVLEVERNCDKFYLSCFYCLKQSAGKDKYIVFGIEFNIKEIQTATDIYSK